MKCGKGTMRKGGWQLATLLQKHMVSLMKVAMNEWWMMHDDEDTYKVSLLETLSIMQLSIQYSQTIKMMMNEVSVFGWPKASKGQSTQKGCKQVNRKCDETQSMWNHGSSLTVLTNEIGLESEFGTIAMNDAQRIKYDYDYDSKSTSGSQSEIEITS